MNNIIKLVSISLGLMLVFSLGDLQVNAINPLKSVSENINETINEIKEIDASRLFTKNGIRKRAELVDRTWQLVEQNEGLKLLQLQFELYETMQEISLADEGEDINIYRQRESNLLDAIRDKEDNLRAMKKHKRRTIHNIMNKHGVD